MRPFLEKDPTLKQTLPNLILIIFRKEFREIFRDKRTRMQVIISPLIITPVLFALVGVLAQGQAERTKTRTYSLGIVNSAAYPDFVKRLKSAAQSSPQFTLTDMKTEAEGSASIRDRKVETVIVFPTDTAQKLASSQIVEVKMLTDDGNENSQNATRILTGVFQKINDGIVKTRLNERGMSVDVLTPFKVAEKNIAGAGGSGMLILTQMLPYLLIFSVFGGSIYAAFDQVAGEKERNTLETLLVSPARRRDIVLGKFMAVFSVGLLSAGMAIIGLMIPFFSHLKIYDWLAQGGLHLSATSIAVIILSVLPMCLLFAGLLLGVSTYARNQKEAQSYLGTLFPLVTLPALLSLFVGTDSGIKIALVPILNASIMIKQALNGNYNPLFIAVAFIASAAYAGLVLLYAIRSFEKESILLKA